MAGLYNLGEKYVELAVA